MNTENIQWWSNLYHGGMLLDTERLSSLVPSLPPPLDDYQQNRFRRELIAFRNEPDQKRNSFVAYVLENICGFALPNGKWFRGGNISSNWTRRGLDGEAIRPGHLWLGHKGATLPVFINDQKQLGIGRGRRIYSQVLQWLRQSKLHLALITNGYQWRIVFAGLDYEAFCQWDIDQWFDEGQTSLEFSGFKALLSPPLWTPPEEGKESPFLAAINDSRKGQADLSQILGERVRQAAELLLRAHTPVLNNNSSGLDPQDIYRAAVRMIMRLVVILFAESREGLLPKDNPVYHGSYSLQGLRELLERTPPYKLRNSYGAYPRFLALLQLIYHGSSHEAMPVTSYGGELFTPGQPDASDGMKRALYLFETACFKAEIMNDYEMRQILDLLTRTRIKIRQGRSTSWITAPVDFSSLGSEYMGILYEGLLDYELQSAPEGEPIVFLAVGNQPALPLSTLEHMDNSAIKNLLEKLKDTSSGDDDEEKRAEEESEGPCELDEEKETLEEEPYEEELENNLLQDEQPTDDTRYTLQARAEQWARRACEVGSLVQRPRGKMTPEKQMQYERNLDTKARQLVTKVVLPGEWFLARWGGTRKGSGTFYTRPQLAIPTTHRTLRPLAYMPPVGTNNQPDYKAPFEEWVPRKPEEILNLKVCDPACGSGSFCLAALRFLTNALYESLVFYGRIRQHGGRAVLDLIYDEQSGEALVNENLPCRPEDDDFEPRTKALLRRYVVERCIYGVDIDPLAVELCRLSLWIETLDRSLPLTFLNHKIKVGNSLVGTWFDQFLHYPAMAFEREGGDKNHTNGVHYPKEKWTKEIKQFKSLVKNELIKFIDSNLYIDDGTINVPIDLATVRKSHSVAESALIEIHNLGITHVYERAEKYNALRASSHFQKLKDAFDLWCALWFWPADQLDKAPLPLQFAAGKFSEDTLQIVRQLAHQHKFFHWELEFPDVFNAASEGFDAILGNPPWDIAKPNSKEFFSAYDPLYRSYGKQEAIRVQTNLFQRNAALERHWLNYNAIFKSMSNWVKYAGFPFGDRITYDSNGRPHHDFNLGDRGGSSFDSSQYRHERWRAKREQTKGYADKDHSYRYQGSADINSYKLFLEQAHALLARHGRFGLIVPSGLYSDHGTRALRQLLMDRCRWEWLFGFENRKKIFDIHSSFKFNPIIVAKGGKTQAIQTVFMRRNLADWEQAEQFAIEYPRQQIVQFSPNSRAILEIQSQRDLEVLTKIYSNSVLLGDQSEKGWGIKYAREFDMTNDSRLFPPRTKWEEWGYRPDEYSRWIKGPWKPIDKLYAELGINPLRKGERRCAQPPYDRLPIPRADIPAGIILSREADAWIHEEEIPTVTFTDAAGKPLKIKIKNQMGRKVDVEVNGPAIALPLYQGVAIWQLNNCSADYKRGANHSAQWEKRISYLPTLSNPQFIISGNVAALASSSSKQVRICFRAVQNATNQRTMIATVMPKVPAGNSLGVLQVSQINSLILSIFMCDFAYDYSLRPRMSQANLNWFILSETPVPSLIDSQQINKFLLLLLKLTACNVALSDLWISTKKLFSHKLWKSMWAITEHERNRLRSVIDAISLAIRGLNIEDVLVINKDCDYPKYCLQNSSFTNELYVKGFWRVDKDKHPEHRHTVLTLIAFHDLQEKIASCGGDVEKGIEAFCNQNNGEGWMLPETLRLTDYGLDHDDRAKEHQPVREYFGPRFYDWQLAQSSEESWRECHLHARNLLGEAGYRRLLDEIEGKEPEKQPQRDLGMIAETPAKYIQKTLLDNYSQKSIFGLEE